MTQNQRLYCRVLIAFAWTAVIGFSFLVITDVYGERPPVEAQTTSK